MKAIAFDAFGTLLKPVGRPGPIREFALVAGIGDPRSFRYTMLTEDKPASEIASAMGLDASELDEAIADDAATTGLFADARVAMAALVDRSIPFVVCSNLAFGYGVAVRRLVPDASAYIFSFEVGSIKPEPEIYQAAVRALGVDPADILFIGDSPSADVTGPRKQGMQAEHLDRGRGGDLVAIIDRWIGR